MTTRDPTPLYWRDQEVGRIEGLKIDNYFIYGRWLPRPSPALDAFLEAVASEGGVEVTIGHATSSWIGSVAEVPGDEIDIRLRGPSADPYLIDAARRMQTIVEDWEWTIETGVMLVQLLQIYEVVFVDGFILNGDDTDTLVGVADASAIVAAIAPWPENAGWEWWSRRGASSTGLHFPEGLANELMTRISRHPSVAAVPDWPGSGKGSEKGPTTK